MNCSNKERVNKQDFSIQLVHCFGNGKILLRAWFFISCQTFDKNLSSKLMERMQMNEIPSQRNEVNIVKEKRLIYSIAIVTILIAGMLSRKQEVLPSCIKLFWRESKKIIHFCSWLRTLSSLHHSPSHSLRLLFSSNIIQDHGNARNQFSLSRRNKERTWINKDNRSGYFNGSQS